MENLLVSMKDEELSKKFGYAKNYILNHDFVIIKGENRRKVLSEIHKNKDKKTVFDTASEEMLRFVLEKTPVNYFMGIENVNWKDSVHYVRGGLDQISCKIAAAKKKKYLISFSDILHSQDRSKLLKRIAFNLELCDKYNVEVIVAGFKDVRSVNDIQAFLRVLKKKEKLYK
jgi:RNase P/RNase MRP subunit p30